jgi:hypothetical protein
MDGRVDSVVGIAGLFSSECLVQMVCENSIVKTEFVRQGLRRAVVRRTTSVLDHFSVTGPIVK